MHTYSIWRVVYGLACRISPAKASQAVSWCNKEQNQEDG